MTTCHSPFYLDCKCFTNPCVHLAQVESKIRGVFSTFFLWKVDVNKSRIECEEFILAERDRKVFETAGLGEPSSMDG